MLRNQSMTTFQYVTIMKSVLFSVTLAIVLAYKSRRSAQCSILPEAAAESQTAWIKWATAQTWGRIEIGVFLSSASRKKTQRKAWSVRTKMESRETGNRSKSTLLVTIRTMMAVQIPSRATVLLILMRLEWSLMNLLWVQSNNLKVLMKIWSMSH